MSSGGGGGDGMTTKPFGEWLSGGLFFGKGKAGGIETSVDSCKDVVQLLNAIHDDLTVKMTQQQQQQQGQSEIDVNSTEPRFLEVRLNRVRVLLYDERKASTALYQQQQCQQESQNQSTTHRRSESSPSGSTSSTTTTTVAGMTMHALTTGDRLKNLLPKLIDFMPQLSFESRKHVASVFNYLLVCGFEGPDRNLYKNVMMGFRDYIAQHFDILLTHIVKGYDCSSHGSTDVGLHSGSMYRSCFKHVILYNELISTTERVQRYVLPLLDTYVHVPNFDISSCAMESLKVVLTAGSNSQVIGGEEAAGQKRLAELAASFLTRDYEMIWDQRFNPNLMSDTANYMTKRMALQILSTVLLTRSNYAIMIKYVNSRRNLILVMHLLRDTSPHITLDAFHVFKVFVANPNKIPEVTKILKDNSPKLCAYLETLHIDKEASDTQFRDEKALIISTLRSL